jgi:hypothetical protein
MHVLTGNSIRIIHLWHLQDEIVSDPGAVAAAESAAVPPQQPANAESSISAALSANAPAGEFLSLGLLKSTIFTPQIVSLVWFGFVLFFFSRKFQTAVLNLNLVILPARIWFVCARESRSLKM